MYVRVRFDKQTVFVSCKPTDTVESVVSRACAVMQKDGKNCIVSFKEKPISPTSTLSEASVVSDSLLVLSA